MRLTVTVNPATSLAAGYEPVDYLEVDVAQLTPEQRRVIAAIMVDGARIRPTLDTPTVEALLAAAHAWQEAVAAGVAAQAAARAADDTTVAALRRILETRSTVEQVVTVAPWHGKLAYTYLTIYPKESPLPYDLPDDMRTELVAWRAECAAENTRRGEAAAAEFWAGLQAGIDARAAMSIDALIASLPEKLREQVPNGVTAIRSDDGREIVLAGPSAAGFSFEVDINLDWQRVESGLSQDGSRPLLQTVTHTIDDGVLKIENSTWVARVADPLATKPAYEFMRRCPGGYDVPELAVGDIIVWGATDRRGRKIGPYDRLVYSVTEIGVSVIKCDYATARRIRKALVK